MSDYRYDRQGYDRDGYGGVYSLLDVPLREVPEFLPVRADELDGAPDFVLVTGDAYVDHPSFGAALLGKLLWAHGYTVGVIAQPDWRSAANFKVFGRPKLGFLITSGNVDSMVNHYSVAKKKRAKDYYSPGGKAGLRPDRALSVYGRRVREAYGDVAIIAGGLEASLRRLSHYDYWSDNVRPSVLIESGADILVYGMGERQLLEIAELLAAGAPVQTIQHVAGTVYAMSEKPWAEEAITLPSYEDCKSDHAAYARSFKSQYENAVHLRGKALVEPYEKLYVCQNPPAAPLTTAELDMVYGLHYTRAPHPMYTEPVPSIEEVRFSVVSVRGCFGGCNFCALSFHQGRAVTSRSHESILREAELITNLPDFKGYIHDVGGPTANFRKPSCAQQSKNGICTNKRCLAPEPCRNLEVDHKDFRSLLQKLRKLPKVKKVFVRSGIRFDYLMLDKDKSFLKELCEHHVSGQLKVAPEHVSKEVLKRMGKPYHHVYDDFVQAFTRTNEQIGKKQFIVPYLMSSHPGSGLGEAVELAEYLHKNRLAPEQVQDFYPTPGTISSCMYHTGVDPITGEKVFIDRSPHGKAMQRALIQYRLPQNRALVLEALKLAKRTDLIGFDKKCLIKPLKSEKMEKWREPRQGEPQRPRQTEQRREPKQAERPAKKKKTIRNVHKKKNNG